jgi:hypothetical protein
MVLIVTPLLMTKAADVKDTDIALNRAAYQSSAINYDNVAQLATDGRGETFWQSKPEDQSWIYVDLGGLRKIDGVKLEWGALAPAGCSIQVPREANSPTNWMDIAHLACAGAQTSGADFPAIEARFLRMLTDKGSTPSGCQLNEFVIKGQSPPTPLPADLRLPPPDEEGKISMDGAGWKLQNAAFVPAAGEAISRPSFPEESWLPSKVPGTVLNSYLLAGAIADPNFGDHQKLVSESFFQNDFWYRKEFASPRIPAGGHCLLNFSGINWKADIYLNGSRVGHVDGAFQRGVFDVTGKLLTGQKNILAVLIHKCPHPGPTNEKTLARMSHNGGVLGLDSPTFVASQGWNWMPSIRGRNIGIWDHVYLEETGPVELVDPFVHTTVARDLHQADVNVEVTLKNLGDVPADTTLTGSLGDLSFGQRISLAAGETKTVKLDRNAFPQLTLINPHLWWPNGYGGQPLQHLKLTAMVNRIPSCTKVITFGIRELAYDTSNGILKLSCNGQHIQLNGGNWGMDDSMLRYEARDYDVAIRLHKAMNMVMIRNWVGQVGKEEFFDACDKYGILVWNDFWLANPSDGPNPQDEGMFMANVRDRVARIRNHPSLALYCGRNEGNPPKDLDQGMAAETSSLDGTRYYIPNSASGLVTGHGPYEPKDDSWYFKNRGVTLHSELGLVCVPTADTMRLMMPEEDLWPINDMWGLHDFAQSRDRVYVKRINDLYGPSRSLDEFCEKAQLQNWENAKAMFEAWRSNSGSGGLAWMSHPAWPSLICQFYDFYLNPTGAYFGARNANEPLHILWDSSSNEVKVANNTGRPFENLDAEAWVFNMDGVQMSHQEAHVDSVAGGTATNCFNLTFPAGLSPVHFIKLRLTSGSQGLSENFYWRGLDEHNWQALNQMDKVNLSGSSSYISQGGQSVFELHLENPTDHIALMACVKIVKVTDPGKRVLPIFYSDNYVSLLPHEKRDLRAQFDQAALDGDRPKVIVDGWNVVPFEIENN